MTAFLLVILLVGADLPMTPPPPFLNRQICEARAAEELDRLARVGAGVAFIECAEVPLRMLRPRFLGPELAR